MANSRFAYNNLLLGSSVVITSSSDAVGYPSANLSNRARYKRWRSVTVNTDHWIKFDLGANAVFQLLAVVSAKITTGGTLNVQANATDVWTSPTVNQVVAASSPDTTEIWAYYLPATQNLRWFRFYFTNTGPINDYAEIGVAFAGPYYEPSHNVSAPAGRGTLNLSRIDPSNIVFSVNGNEFAQKRKKIFAFNGMYWFLTDADVTSFRTMYDSIGQTDPMIYALDPNDQTKIFYSRFAAPPAESYEKHRAGGSINWSVPVSVKEYV